MKTLQRTKQNSNIFVMCQMDVGNSTKKDDVEIVDPKFVFYGPVQATSISKAGYHFGDDDIQASNVYRNIKTIN